MFSRNTGNVRGDMLATIPKGANTQRCPSSAGVDASMSQVREGRLLPRMTDRLTSLVVRNERIKPDVMLKFYLDIIGTRTSSRSPKFMGLSSSKKTTLRRRPPPPSTSARWCLTVTSGRSFACSSRRSKYISLSFTGSFAWRCESVSRGSPSRELSAITWSLPTPHFTERTCATESTSFAGGTVS